MANRFTHEAWNEPLRQNDAELDDIKALLVSLLIKNTSLDRDEIYSYVFGDGKQIIWN
jgi:hypothetical protein